MTFIAPEFFFAAMAAAAAIAALHFLVTRQPRAAVLPTARFVPDLPATATSRTTRPSDLLLLLLRMLLVLAAGAALAGPMLKPSRHPEARVILADVSASVGDAGSIGDSVRSLYRRGDLLIAFDSAAREMTPGAMDSLVSMGASSTRGNDSAPGRYSGGLTGTPTRGNLAAALITAIRAGSGLSDRADSIDLVVVSPLASEEWGAATDSIRALWPGRARIVRAGTFVDTLSRGLFPMTTRATPNDPLNVTVSLSGIDRELDVRLVRDDLTAADIQWSAESDRVLVAWPVSARPAGAVRRAAGRDSSGMASTIGGVVSDSAIVIATFNRMWQFPADSLKGVSVVARWIDGEPAAVERPTGDGCVRSVAIPVTQVGDFAIRPDFVRLARVLTGPCRSSFRSAPLAAGYVASLAGSEGLAARESFRARTDVRSSLAPWLFGLAMVAAIAELFVRGSRSRGV